ncbi:MAG: outer membrane beta-barrel protein [Paludibacteraceae bacterium]|nr:outer membrane beta-barrel protein [Paludibacteraceae bacterium]
MKLKWLITSVALFFAATATEAKIKLKLGLETGYQIYVGEHLKPQLDKEADAEEVNNAPSEETLTNYNPILPTDDESYMHCIFGGLTGEILWRRERYGITTGARYTQFIDIYDFDLKQTTSTDEGEVETFQSKKLTQRTHYVGFPVEFRFLATRAGRPCRFYFKMGSSWNFLMATDNLVKSRDPETGEESEKNLSDVGREPDKFIGTLYPAIGCRFFSYRPHLNVELHLPSFIINMPASYFAHNIGLGLNVSIQFPTDKKSYETYRQMGAPYY